MLPLLPAYFVAVTSALSISCLITLVAPNLSAWIPALTTYGKTSLEIKDQPKFLQAISVPKKWFTHFYILALLNISSWLVFTYLLLTHATTTSPEVTEWLKKMTPVAPKISWTAAVLVLVLMFLHVFRRCYESLYVSVYSDSNMNIGHYVMGLVHYFILPLTILCEADGFVNNRRGKLIPKEIDVLQWFGIVFFFYCNWQQHLIVQKMAKVRKLPDGLVSDYLHGIFYGGWFNFISCPHFLFEIGIYFSLWLIVPMSYCYTYLFVFVAVNQIFAALISHRWYLNKFAKYPKGRKAIIPYML